MPTKLRSACDRCHQTKVKCSGDIPCQGCLASRSLCFYSVSCPLGRPRGTKNSHGRGRSRGNNTSQQPSATVENGSRTTGAGSVAKKTLLRQSSGSRRGSYDNRMAIDQQSCGEVDNQQDNILSRMRPSDWKPTNNLHYENQNSEQHGYSLSEFLTNDDIASISVSVMPQDLKGPSTYDLNTMDTENMATMSEIPMSSYTSHSNSTTHTPDSWESIALSLDKNPAELFDATHLEDPANFQGLNFHENHYNIMQKPTPLASTKISDVFTTAVPANPPTATVSQIGTPTCANFCTCLQQHAELLSDPRCSEILASQDSDDALLSIDKALALVTQGMKAWRNLAKCPHCPYNHDQDVMLLAFMSIRAITRYLQRLAPRYVATSLHGTPSKSTSGNPVPVPPAGTPQSSEGDSRVTIGSFEIEGDERTLVHRALFQHMLRMVKSTLHSLQSIQDKRKKQLLEETSNRTADDDDYQASSNMFHIQQICHKLFASIQALELSLNNI